ncbi:MAG TPA: Amuc_1100 family pilus-like protein [Methylomirabilota bacterium]|nr:Amuc_1100 family pilus-like protein [Methylomirabilota bacterium]
MLWIKRNLGFVVGGAVALALMGFAGWFLYSQLRESRGVSDQLEQKLTELRSLYNRRPFPNTNNIALAREQQKVIAKHEEEARRFFMPTGFEQTIGPNDDEAFKNLLETTIYELHQSAKTHRVRVPANRFSFSFEAQRTKARFASGSIPTLTTQLADVKAICAILFDARVNSLDGVRRVPVPNSDDQGSTAVASDYITYLDFRTNKVGVITPYEFTFRAFSGELADALTGFLESKHGFIVKGVLVEPAPAADFTRPALRIIYESSDQIQRQTRSAEDVMAERYGISRGGREREVRDRYGIGGDYTPPTTPTQPPPQVYRRPPQRVPTGPVTVLKESPLKITLLVEVIRMDETAAEPAGG